MGFTANVNADMKTGSIRNHHRLWHGPGRHASVAVQSDRRAVMDDLQAGKFFGNYGVLVPRTTGSSNDVGGPARTTSRIYDTVARSRSMPLMNG